MRRLPRYCIALITVIAASLAGIQAVGAASNDESGFHSRINGERAGRGLNTLAWNEDLAVVARRHANRMANEDNLYHNPNLRYEVDDWEVVGENVGYGPGVEELHDAFMNSQSHRANILDGSYTQVGVGTTWRGDTLWVVEVFRKPTASASRSGSGSVQSAPKKKNRKTTTTASRPASQSKPQPRPAAPAAEIPPAPAPASSAELTRKMVENLLAGQEPANGSVNGSELLGVPMSLDGSGVVALTFRPFAEIAGRVNRQIIQGASGRSAGE